MARLDTTSAVDEARWAAVVARDRNADSHFVYGVTTTGVYAAPSSAARLPRRENVVFFDTPEQAQQAGFRQSLRRGPDRSTTAAAHADLVAQACRLIEHSPDLPTLDELARSAQLSRHHFHRLFKAVTGLTPKDYARGKQARAVRQALAGGASVTEALHQAGFNASSRFYAQATDMLGMAPGRYARGGAQAEIRFAVADATLGAVLVAASAKGVCAILMGDDPERLVQQLQDRFPHAALTGDDPAFDTLVAQVIGAIETPRGEWTLPLDIRGTVFQQRVWQALRDIAPGQTLSYTELAARIGAPAAVRAVASACAANWIAVAIPCHRIVRSDGALSGYRWGVERKRALLAREAQD